MNMNMNYSCPNSRNAYGSPSGTNATGGSNPRGSYSTAPVVYPTSSNSLPPSSAYSAPPMAYLASSNPPSTDTCLQYGLYICFQPRASLRSAQAVHSRRLQVCRRTLLSLHLPFLRLLYLRTAWPSVLSQMASNQRIFQRTVLCQPPQRQLIPH